MNTFIRQRDADRQAATVLREKITQSAVSSANQLDNAEAAKELAVEKTKVMEMEEKLRQTTEDATRLSDEKIKNINELQKIRLLQTETISKVSNLMIQLENEQLKASLAEEETGALKTRTLFCVLFVCVVCAVCLFVLSSQNHPSSSSLFFVESLFLSFHTGMSEMEEELETAGIDGARSDALTQEVLALKAQHELFESRTTVLQDQVDQKKREIGK